MTDIERLIAELKTVSVDNCLPGIVRIIAKDAAAQLRADHPARGSIAEIIRRGHEREQLRADHPEGGTRSTSDNEWVTAFWKQVRENNAKLDALMAGYRAERVAPTAPGPEAADEAMADACDPAVAFAPPTPKPDYAAQAEAVERAINFLPVMVGPEWRRALSAAARTIRAMPGVVEALRLLIFHDEADDTREGLPHCLELQQARVALRALGGGEMTDYLEIARAAIRRGAKGSDPIPPCSCFRAGSMGTLTGQRCNGVCEDATWYVAQALERLDRAATRGDG